MRSQFGLGILQWWGCCVQTVVDPIVSSPLASCVGPVEGQVPRVVRRLCEKTRFLPLSAIGLSKSVGQPMP